MWRHWLDAGVAFNHSSRGRCIVGRQRDWLDGRERCRYPAPKSALWVQGVRKVRLRGTSRQVAHPLLPAGGERGGIRWQGDGAALEVTLARCSSAPGGGGRDWAEMRWMQQRDNSAAAQAVCARGPRRGVALRIHLSAMSLCRWGAGGRQEHISRASPLWALGRLPPLPACPPAHYTTSRDV